MAALAMLGAAALWGIVGGLVAGLGVSGAAAASVVELVTGVVLTGLTQLRGSSRRVLIALRWRLVLLGLLEAVNVVAYYVALQLAPVGPVMALHLCAPVILTVLALVRRQRDLTARTAVVLAMIMVALALIALGDIDHERYPHATAGYALSLFSAGVLALFVTGVGRVAPGVSPIAAAGAQMLVSGLMLSPALVTVAGHTRDLPPLIVAGVAVFAPACALYWFAMRRLAPIAASTILLAEPFFGTVFALLHHHLVPTWSQAVAALLVLLAVCLDVRTPIALSSR